MSSTDQYLEFVLDLLGELEDVAHRKMMGEYVLYYRGKVIGGIYDDRFLLKVTPASERLLPEAPRAIPYEGAKEMLLVEVEDRDALRDVVDAMWEEVPAPKKRKKKEAPGPGLVLDETRSGLHVPPDDRGAEVQREETNSARRFACSRERSTMSARAASSVRFAYDTPYRGRLPANSMPVSAHVAFAGVSKSLKSTESGA